MNLLSNRSGKQYYYKLKRKKYVENTQKMSGGVMCFTAMCSCE